VLVSEDLYWLAYRDKNAVMVFGGQAIDQELYNQIAGVLVGEEGAFADLGRLLPNIKEKSRRALLALSMEAPGRLEAQKLLMIGILVGYVLHKARGDILEEVKSETDLSG
jgi:hypothetical protein